ncbi:MAG: hypothetical protein WA674_08380 [Candidatus Acidiferrales bacterium]
MIGDAQIAKQVSDLMIEFSGRLDGSIATVRDQCSPEEFATYRRAVGRIMGEMLLEVLNPLYAEHPSLKPAEME